MALKRRQRIIILLYILILFVDSFALIKGQINPRKMDSPNDNSDNYIIVYFFDTAYYDEENIFNKGNRDMVSYIKYQDKIIQKESLNQPINFEKNNGALLEIHFSSCVSNLERFFGCGEDDEYYDENTFYMNSIDFSNFDSSCLESAEKLFLNCSELRTINFSGFNSSKIKNMSHMFYGCNYLESLDISNFDTSNIIDMSHMFYDCYF